MTLTILRSMCRIFRKMLLNWDLSDIFLPARLEVWVLGRKTRSKAPLSSRRIRGIYHGQYFSLLTLIVAEGRVIRLPHSSALFCQPPLPPYALRKDLTVGRPYLRSGWWRPTSFTVEHLQTWFGILHRRFGSLLIKLNVHLSYNPAMPLLHTCSRKTTT